MAHESFEDAEVARLMNEAFVNIKVDREERPDIDGVYMQVAQMITGRGGWPLTIVMTPDKRPFFAATYIPKENRYNILGMLGLIPRLKELWEIGQADIEGLTERIQAALQEEKRVSGVKTLDKDALNKAYTELSHRFDESRGGFSTAPKFLTPHNLLFLLRYWKCAGSERALSMVNRTLHEMRNGGIFDQVGYGFHRYSTDAEWLLPHFEKMLYDQAGLTMAYAEAYLATGNEEFVETVRQIVEYVFRDLRSPEGAFYSAEDADSEGVEGKFYVWSYDEVEAILDPDEFEVFTKVYNIRPEGNFREEATGEETGLNIPHLRVALDVVAAELGKTPSELSQVIETARLKLLSTREERVRPSRDEKVLTDWNGFMIATLAVAGRILRDRNMTSAAERAWGFIQTEMMNEGRLFHRYSDGEVAVPGFLDDHAYTIWGLTELYETTFNPEYLRVAVDLNEHLFAHFWDEEGGFYFTADYAEELLVRRKDAYDGAMPSGNSVALYNTVRLARLLGDENLEDRASETVMYFASEVSRAYSAYSMMLVGLDLAIGPSYELVLAGEEGTDDLEAMIDTLRSRYIPRKVVLLRGDGRQAEAITQLAPFTKFHTPMGGKTTAHVCVNHNCRLPTTDPERMLELMGEGSES